MFCCKIDLFNERVLSCFSGKTKDYGLFQFRFEKEWLKNFNMSIKILFLHKRFNTTNHIKRQTL